MADNTDKAWRSAHENDGKTRYGGRDLVGYGEHPPMDTARWPNGAVVALSFVINYEEGGEACILHGDDASEKLLSEIVRAEAYQGERHVNMESLYDYGSRVGFWRLQRLFVQEKIPCTVFAVGMALERNPNVCSALKDRMRESGWEVASHGYRWIDYQHVDEATERDHIARTIDIHERLLGRRPVGIYQGKPSIRTRKLLVEEGGFKYDSDSYADDVPYWTREYGHKRKSNNQHLPHLIIPYTLSENDMRFVSPANFAHGDAFYQHLKSSLEYAVHEGTTTTTKTGYPTMMSVGLHCRLARPGRVAGLAQFIQYAKSLGSHQVWICTREEIADYWHRNHSP